MKIGYDCRYFRGDMPCNPHKTEDVHCKECPYYDPIKERILIIKLDSIGDVLRTTSILPGLKEKYPYSQITWITKTESVPIFYGNPFIDRVFDLSQAVFVLETDEFDIVINLDAAPLSSRLATFAKGTEKKGFGYDPKGFVYSLNPEAEEWFLMGLFDDIKKANQKTYQSIMLEICGLNPSDYSIIYRLTDEEIRFARRFAKKKGLTDSDLVIGLNTGAGNRWPKKKWTREGYLQLINLLIESFPGVKIFLYGGPEEDARNRYLMNRSKGTVIDTSCNNTIREFATLLNLSSVIVTGDTLALHLSIALNKKVVALVGPTSAPELDLYGQGVKVTADIPCLGCYKTKCYVKPDCMDLISPETVLSSIRKMLAVSV
jgi:ADP-heptose:LPS heptosyltransferase